MAANVLSQKYPFQLPTEILALIFEECVAQAHAHRGRGWRLYNETCNRRCLFNWVHVTQVCSRWRTISLACHKLWSHIVFICPVSAQAMIDRSGATPLTVSALIDDANNQRGLLNILLDHVERVEDLHFEGPKGALERISQRLREAKHSGTVMLQSLALVCPSSRVLIPSPLSCSDSIKRLFLQNVGLYTTGRYPLHVLSGMNALEELWIDDCLGPIATKGHQIDLPNLKYLHLAVDVTHYLEFLSALKQSRPLLFFEMDTVFCHDTLSLFTEADCILRDGKVNIQDLSSFSCALCIGMEDNTWGDKAHFILAGWQRETVSVSQVVSFARHNKIPTLYKDTIIPRLSQSRRRISQTDVLEIQSSFYSTDPALLYSVDLPNLAVGIYINPLSEIPKVFMLRTVVFASISDAGFENDHQEGMFTLLQSMPALRVLEYESGPLGLLTLALSPQDQDDAIPVPGISELWLNNLRLDEYEDPDDDSNDAGSSGDSTSKPQSTPPTLPVCLASRASLGSRLDKLVFRDCTRMDADDWEALQGLNINIEVIGSHPTIGGYAPHPLRDF